MLRRHGIITEAELEQALAYQQEHRVRIGEALLALGFCTDAQISRALADQLGLPFVDMVQQPPTAEALRLLPRGVAQKYGAVPVEKKDGRLVIVARNPLDFTIDAALRQAAGLPVMIVCGVDAQIQNVLQHYDRMLLTAQGSAAVPLPTPEGRLGLRPGLPGGADPSESISKTVNQLIVEGAEEIQLVLRSNTLQVSGTLNGRHRCFTFVPGDRLEISIRPRHGVTSVTGT